MQGATQPDAPPQGTPLTTAERRAAEIIEANAQASAQIELGSSANIDDFIDLGDDDDDDDDLLGVFANPERQWRPDQPLLDGPYALIIPITRVETETNISARGNVFEDSETRPNCTAAKVLFPRKKLDNNGNSVVENEEHRILVPGKTWVNAALAAGVALDDCVRALLSDPNCQNPYWPKNPSASWTLVFITRREARAIERAKDQDKTTGAVIARRRSVVADTVAAAGHQLGAMNRGDSSKARAFSDPSAVGLTLIPDAK